MADRRVAAGAASPSSSSRCPRNKGLGGRGRIRGGTPYQLVSKAGESWWGRGNQLALAGGGGERELIHGGMGLGGTRPACHQQGKGSEDRTTLRNHQGQHYAFR